VSLRLKLGIAIVLFVGTALGIEGWQRTRAETAIVYNEIEQRGITLLRALAIPCGVAMANNDMPALDNYVTQFADAASTLALRYLAVIDYHGKVVAHTDPSNFGKTFDDDFSKSALGAKAPVSRRAIVQEISLLEVAVPVIGGLRWGTLKAGFELTEAEQTLASRRRSQLITTLVISVSTAIIAYLILSFLLLRPIGRLRMMARKFGSGDLGSRVDLNNKDEMGELAAQLNGMARQIQRYTGSLEQLVTERTHALEESNARLEKLARTDGLTGLFNRRHFMEMLSNELQRSKRSGGKFALMFLDVDHFKHYNDNNGHAAGDELLKRLAATMTDNLRSTDIVARYGGEEFVILLPDSDIDKARATGEKLRAIIEETPMLHEETQPNGRLTVSIGAAIYPVDAESDNMVLKLADEALYDAKAHGRNRFVCWRDISVAGATG